MPREGPAKGLSIFFPAYNDSGTIASMVIRAVKAASKLTSDFEIVVVDDGSAGRALVAARFGWPETAARLEFAYDRALAFKSLTR